MLPALSPQELQTWLHDGQELALLDIREEGQFGENHLLFSTPLAYSRLELDISRLVPRLPTRIVLCDESEDLSPRAAQRLLSMGYTEVRWLKGGVTAWGQAGLTLFKGVNVPSKLFGELVELNYHTPHISVQELAQMQKGGEDFILLDGRPYAEYHKMSIPGAICCPNAELPYRLHQLVDNPKTKIIVNCAGRTRSIMGAQGLRNFGVNNPVYALENGTQGWVLAGFELEHGATRTYPSTIDPKQLLPLQQKAKALMAQFGIQSLSTAEAQRWVAQATHSVYFLDIRTAEEFQLKNLLGSIHAPGGQLIQATDQWAAVRQARLVLIDNDQVRAPIVATWLKQMGCEVYVLQDGIDAPLSLPPLAKPALPPLERINAAELKQALQDPHCRALDLGPSLKFRQQHIEKTQWSIRSRIVEDAAGATQVILLSEDLPKAQLAAIELIQSGIHQIKLYSDGMDSWKKSGFPVLTDSKYPEDADCIDFLFFVHDRHSGNREAMRQYLAWETGLIKQLNEQDKASFSVGWPTPHQHDT